MANERRVRSNYDFGTLSVGLAAGDTNLSSVGLAGLPAIDTYSYAALTISNPATGAYEIVYVTAHALNATTATIVRGREGTAAQAWTAGLGWVHAPTARDLVLAGRPRTIFFDDCDDAQVPDGVQVYNGAAPAYNAQRRSREFAALGQYITPAFVYSGAPGILEVTWSRISAVGTGQLYITLRASPQVAPISVVTAGFANAIGIWIAHEAASGNDVVYRGGGTTTTGITSAALDKTGQIVSRIQFDSAGNWNAGIECGARGVLLQGASAAFGGNVVAGTAYQICVASDSALTWRLHKMAVYG